MRRRRAALLAERKAKWRARNATTSHYRYLRDYATRLARAVNGSVRIEEAEGLVVEMYPDGSGYIA